MNDVVIAKKGNSTIELDLDGTELVAEYISIKDKEDRLDLNSTKVLLKFKKVVSAYLSEYPELAKKISNKEKGYKVLNVLSISLFKLLTISN